MPQIINTNIPSLNAQRNLDRSGQSLATSLQRLSSGLRTSPFKAGVLMPEEYNVKKFHDWIARQMAGADAA